MKRYETSYVLLIILTIAILVGEGVLISFYKPLTTYATPEMQVKTIQFNKTALAIPSWDAFKLGNIWSIVSGTHTISLTYTPQLTEVTVAHTTGANQVAETTMPHLQALFDAASKDGVKLMLSSAYRSAADQKKTYEAYAAMNGKAYVQEYVAAPGASEHQTGLAVDIASETSACKTDAAACSLDADAIAWLRAHAPEYGFIERYPAGKQSITGIAGEHWHYRYVGIALAKALTASQITLDEFVTEVAPGYLR